MANEKALGLKTTNWGESQKTGHRIQSARKETETEKEGKNQKQRDTHAGTVDKDIRKSDAALSHKVEENMKRRAYNYKNPYSGQNQISLLSAITCEISLSQANLDLVSWWNTKFHKKSLKLKSNIVKRVEAEF